MPEPRSAKSRAFGLQRPRSISETDSALEGDGFEPSVPRDSDDPFSLEFPGPAPFGKTHWSESVLLRHRMCLTSAAQGISSRCRRSRRSHGKNAVGATPGHV
jgi:hypothetical protein